MSRVLTVFVVGLIFSISSTAQIYGQKTVFELQNGLHVILQPLPTAKTTALVVLYDVGNIHDPKGRSGLAHLAEHLYVTSATQNQPARSVQQYVRHYPDGWNAQTGDRYTVIATVFKPDRLDDEIKDAGQRMNKVIVAQSDLTRELPRIKQELDNMYGRMPQLVVRNQGRQYRRPLPHGGKRGGKFEEIQQVKLSEVQRSLDEHYKPANAVLVLAGPLDLSKTKQSVEKAFASIPEGVRPIANDPQKPPGRNSFETEIVPIQTGGSGRVGLTFAAPHPDHRLYPAFLVHVTRMLGATNRLSKNARDFPVAYMPIDDPGFFYVSLPVADGSTADSTANKLREFVQQQVSIDLKPTEIQSAKARMGMFLGLREMPTQMLSMNPYGTAFSLGRRHQMGIDSQRLSSALNAVDQQLMNQAAKEVFGSDNQTTVLVRAKK